MANEVDGEIDRYDFRAETRFDKLYTGVASPRLKSLPHGTSGAWRILARRIR